MHVALASPDGALRRIAMDGFPTMENAVSMRVLHSGDRTIFVWVKRVFESSEPSFSIEICAIPDARLRAQPVIPFD